MAAGWTHDITSQKCLEGAYDPLWNANLFKIDRHHQPARAVLPASAAHHRLMNNDWNVKRSTVKLASEVLRFGERRVRPGSNFAVLGTLVLPMQRTGVHAGRGRDTPCT